MNGAHQVDEVGDEPALVAELRLALIDSAARALAALEAAGDEDGWRVAAWRLNGLAASFGAVRLMALATAAGEGVALDQAALRKLKRAVERL